ncbi:alpha/beta-hydrolase [Clavulina sp. PMI_390]|nr:alpha/beta-hydrolase [Clavulina sp. PMI_390]
MALPVHEQDIPEFASHDNNHYAEDLAPLVIVEGFLSSTAPFLWGKFEDHLNAQREELGLQGRRRVIFASVGPVSSLHDRACELYYALRGGTVHYGWSHSLHHGHRPYGRTHTKGLYPSWSPSRPLHFLGHSMGGPTITTMLTLIREGFFEDNSDHLPPNPPLDDSMVASVTTVSAPFRGTGVVYDLGERTDAAPDVRVFSFGSFVTKFVYAIEYFSPLIPAAWKPDFHAESRALSLHEQSFSEFVRMLFAGPGDEDWAQSKDATPWDCTFEAAADRDRIFWSLMPEGTSATTGGKSRGRTWYRSYVSCMTEPRREVSRSTAGVRHAPASWTQALDAGFLYFSSRSLGRFDYSTIRPAPEFRPPIGSVVEEERRIPRPLKEYFANDGVVPVFSQWHPGECWPGVRCIHHDRDVADEPDIVIRLGEGRTKVEHLEKHHHLSIMPLWMGTDRQRAFWRELGEWLEDVDEARGALESNA